MNSAVYLSGLPPAAIVAAAIRVCWRVKVAPVQAFRVKGQEVEIRSLYVGSEGVWLANLILEELQLQESKRGIYGRAEGEDQGAEPVSRGAGDAGSAGRSLRLRAGGPDDQPGDDAL